MLTPDGRAISVSINAITRQPLYLDPTEADIHADVRDFHPDLFLDVNTEVTLVEFHRHAVKYVKGHRFGFAALSAFGLHHSVDLNVILPQAFDEQYGSGEVRRHPSPPGLTRDPNQVPRMIYDYDSTQNQIPDVESGLTLWLATTKTIKTTKTTKTTKKTIKPLKKPQKPLKIHKIRPRI